MHHWLGAIPTTYASLSSHHVPLVVITRLEPNLANPET
jgi:hypothetical protein